MRGGAWSGMAALRGQQISFGLELPCDHFCLRSSICPNEQQICSCQNASTTSQTILYSLETACLFLCTAFGLETRNNNSKKSKSQGATYPTMQATSWPFTDGIDCLLVPITDKVSEAYTGAYTGTQELVSRHQQMWQATACSYVSIALKKQDKGKVG